MKGQVVWVAGSHSVGLRCFLGSTAGLLSPIAAPARLCVEVKTYVSCNTFGSLRSGPDPVHRVLLAGDRGRGGGGNSLATGTLAEGVRDWSVSADRRLRA